MQYSSFLSCLIGCGGWVRSPFICGMLLACLLVTPVQSDSGPQIEFRTMPTGIGTARYAPQGWGAMGLVVINRGPQDEILTAMAYADRLETLQFARQLWVPADSERTDWIGLRAPEQIAPDERTYDVTTVLLRQEGGRDQSVGRHAALHMFQATPMVSMVLGSNLSDEQYDFMEAAMRAVGPGMSRPVFSRRLPAVGMLNESAQWVVIASPPRVPIGQAEASALRDWLVEGGVLWLMLDELPDEAMGQWLGLDWTATILQRLPVTQWQLRDPARAQSTVYAGEMETPVDFVRVVPGGNMQVLLANEGWPVAMTFAVGRGQVLVTTLGAEAWIGQSEEMIREVIQSVQQASVRNQPVLDSQLLKPVVVRQIGGRVISAQLVATVLGLYWLVMLVAWWVLARQGRMERMGLLGVAASVVFALILVGLGSMTRQEIPPMAVTAAFADLSIGQQRVAQQMQVGIYSPGGATVDISGQNTVLWPQQAGRGGSIQRLVWEDVDRWAWRNWNLPAGAIMSASMSQVQTLDTQPARWTLGPQGLSITLAPQLPTLADVVVGGAGGISLVSEDAADTLHGGPQGHLWPNAHLDLTSTGETSLLRSRLYRRMEQSLQRRGVVTLLGWTSDLPETWSPGIDAQRRQQVMLQVPLTFDRPEPGPVIVPWVLMNTTHPSRQDPDGQVAGRVTVYDLQQDEWLQVTQEGKVVLRFHPPVALLPMQVDSIKVRLEMQAPGRQVQLILPQIHRSRAQAHVAGPSGAHTFNLELEKPLTLDQARDGITLILDIGAGQDPLSPGLWRIEKIHMMLAGQVLAAQP